MSQPGGYSTVGLRLDPTVPSSFGGGGTITHHPEGRRVCGDRSDTPYQRAKLIHMRKGQYPGQGITIVKRQFILDQFRAGHLVIDIAASLGVTYQAISMPMCSSPDYRAAREFGARQRLIALVHAHKSSRELRWARMRYQSDFGMAAWNELAAKLKRLSSDGKK